MNSKVFKKSRLSALVLAGGLGTRIRHLTGEIPKPLVEVNGRPFLHWVIRGLKNKGVVNLYLLNHFRAEMIEEFARAETCAGFQITCITEPEPAGTGGSVLDFLASSPALSDPFLVLNGDSILVDYDVSLALEKLAEGFSAVIFGVPMNDASRYGTLKFDSSDMLTAFEEKRPGEGIVNSGVYLFSPDLNVLVNRTNRPLSMEKELFPEMILRGMKICVVRCASPFIDIGTEASLHEATAFISKHCTEN